MDSSAAELPVSMPGFHADALSSLLQPVEEGEGEGEGEGVGEGVGGGTPEDGINLVTEAFVAEQYELVFTIGEGASGMCRWCWCLFFHLWSVFLVFW
jgi:hypothetical protein